MKTTIATRFRCRCPLTNLTQLTLMLTTLILQYLNKLSKGEVGDLTSPEPLHAIKIERFNGNRIEPFTEFRGELPMKVCALIRNFTIQTRYCSNTTPPAVRTFYLTAQVFVESAKFLQGAFQRLGLRNSQPITHEYKAQLLHPVGLGFP